MIVYIPEGHLTMFPGDFAEQALSLKAGTTFLHIMQAHFDAYINIYSMCVSEEVYSVNLVIDWP